MEAGIVLAAAPARSACSSAARSPMLGGEPDVRPEVGLGEPPEPEVLPSAIGLVWRALILWLLVILLVTLANYARCI